MWEKNFERKNNYNNVVLEKYSKQARQAVFLGEEKKHM